MCKKYEVAAYYFPNYHQDKNNEKWHGQGWTEWELVKRAEPRFETHEQPKLPLWGFEDEADPQVMEKKISAAADHGLTAFIFDWYWHNEGPFLHRCLEDGYLKASNNHRIKFSLMWANHDWLEIHPATRHRSYPVLAEGGVSEQVFISATDHMINNYFGHSSYWRVGGGLYFSIYELMSLVKGFGGIVETKRILSDFRNRVRSAGLGEIHLNAIIWGVQLLPNEETVKNPNEMLEQLGFDSVTSYVWIHHMELDDFPRTSYAWCREQYEGCFEQFSKEYRIPYFPNVTMGWDSSPRTIQSDIYDNLGYPFMPTICDNSPEEFEIALIMAKEQLNRVQHGIRVLTINAWNEWTEGSYLEPDQKNGMGYLAAIKRVFG